MIFQVITSTAINFDNRSISKLLGRSYMVAPLSHTMLLLLESQELLLLLPFPNEPVLRKVQQNKMFKLKIYPFSFLRFQKQELCLTRNDGNILNKVVLLRPCPLRALVLTFSEMEISFLFHQQKIKYQILACHIS